jgi:predicted ATP-binding protein involved in virulence
MAKSKGGSKKPPANGKPHGRNGQPERLGSYFLSLTLENVRCFGPKQTLDLSDGHGKPARWTVIFGLNGTGKTTILQALAGFELIPMSAADPETIYLNRLWHLPQQDPGITWTSFRRHPNNREAELRANIAVSSAFDGVVHQVIERHASIDPKTNGSMVSGSRSVVGRPVAELTCSGYGAGRRMGSTSLAESGTDPTMTLFSDKVNLRNPEEWLLWLDYAAAKDSNEAEQRQARLDQAKRVLLGVMPEGEITDIRFVTAEGTNPTSSVEFKTPYGWVPLRQLGYGYRTLITWVADFANRMVERYPDSPDPLAEPAVVLVDEIDLHLHPVWQRKLMGFLTERFPNTQFIVTAHSPLVAQAAEDANLAVLRREGDHVVIDNDVDGLRNLSVDQILTSELFGLKTARPPRFEPLFEEHEKLATKAKRTKAEEKRLAELQEAIDQLPFGETALQRRGEELIRESLDLLLKERASPK